jgi:hypothetical protein
LSLKKASNNPKVLWHLADQALGKDRPSLPASITGANGSIRFIRGRESLGKTSWSYCQVSILPAMSKVLESLVKGDLEGHLKRVNGLPRSQYGFHPNRSCTSALAHAQAGWLSGAAKGRVVGLMAFDLSAAFDTVAAEQLAQMLRALGITGRELRWFLCYMSGGKQCLVWDGTVSGLINVLYGVCQGSILRPILFIILTSGMAEFLGVMEDENIVYAHDSNVWQTGSTKEEVARKLAEKAALFVEYTRRMGLSMNAAKTLLFTRRQREPHPPGRRHRALGSEIRQEAVDHTPYEVLARGREATGFSRRPTLQPPAKGGVPAAVVLRVGHGQVLTRAGGRGKAEAGV